MRFFAALAVLAATVLAATMSPSIVTGVDARGDRQDRFDSYMLAQFWQPAECEGASYRGCQRPRNNYMANSLVIHGLWPEFDGGKRNSDGDTYPSYCTTDKFPSYTSWPGSIISKMEKYWPSVRDDRDGLWEHEWKKHGTCTTYSPQQYLEKTIELQKQIGTPALLRRNVGGTVSSDQLQAAYRPAGARSGSWAKLSCKQGELREVRTCWTRDFKRKPCRSGGSCGRTISIVQKTGWPLPADECNSRAKQSCQRQNKAACQPYDTACGECLIGWKADPRSSRGTCIKEDACNDRVNVLCAKAHASPCSRGSAECGSCLAGYSSDGNGKCVGAASMTISRPRDRSRYSKRSGEMTVKWANDRCGAPILMTLYRGDDQVDEVLEETQRHGSLKFTIPASLEPGSDYRVYLIADGGAGCEVFSPYFTIDA